MALDKEIWSADIQELLRPTNEHLQYATDDTNFVMESPNSMYKIVHIPQAGADASVAINRGSVPATIGSRTDTDFTYQVDEYTTDPILLRNLTDREFLSYDKRASVMKAQMEVLRLTMGTQALYRWAEDLTTGNGRVIRTTGAASSTALAPSATGTRKAITVQDVINLSKILDKDNIAKTGRKLLMDSDLYHQFIAENPDVSRANEFGMSTLPDGIVNRFFGFDVMLRSENNIYDGSGVIKAVGAAGAIGDNLSALAWHPDYVSKANAGVEIFSNFGDGGSGLPEYYGGIISASVFFGAKYRRADFKGIVSLAQEA